MEVLVRRLAENAIVAIKKEPDLTQERALVLIRFIWEQVEAHLPGGTKECEVAYAPRLNQAFRERFGGEPFDGLRPPAQVIPLERLRKLREIRATGGALILLKLSTHIQIGMMSQNPEMTKEEAEEILASARIHWMKEAPEHMDVFDQEIAPRFEQVILDRFGPDKVD